MKKEVWFNWSRSAPSMRRVKIKEVFMQSSKWVSLLVLSALLSSAPAFARAAAPTLAAEKAAARVQASLSQKTRLFRRDPELP
ncbi:hypothetical protein M5E89_11280 [Acidaminococcus intestini]|nr:hypothetical protein M5E89_11280 [Acidaminococcus intestini]